MKEQSNIPVLILEQQYVRALQGCNDGTFKSFQNAAEAYNLSKSSLGHQKNGHCSGQLPHHREQICSPAIERAIVR